MDIGTKIRKARMAKGLTQAELGDLLGVKNSAIAKYESGRVVNIKRNTIKRMSEILGLELHELIVSSETGTMHEYVHRYADVKKLTTTDRLLQIMEERRLKQTDILRMAEPYCKQYNVKLDKGTMSAYVHGRYVPAQDKLFVLAKALNVSEAWLMGLDVPMDRNTTKPHQTEIAPEVERLIAYCKRLTPQQADQLLQTIRLLLGDADKQ